MSEQNTRNLLMNAALALGAGALGSVLTLLVTNKLPMPVASDRNSLVVQAPEQPGAIPTKVLLDSAPADQPLIDDPLFADNRAESLDEMRNALTEASEERAQLAMTLVQLTRQIDVLESDLINSEAREALQTAVDQTAQDGSGTPDAGVAGRSAVQQRIDSLIAAGVDSQRAQEIQARQDQYQLARLDLIDQAERENWRDTDEFNQRMALLDEQQPDLRNELGDENYDRFLFESGRNNRVMVSAVIPGSVAETVGLLAGDVVISYANQRVFTRRELQAATREGLRGEIVGLTVQRQGQSLFFDVPRGPLGVSMSAEKQNPT